MFSLSGPWKESNSISAVTPFKQLNFYLKTLLIFLFKEVPTSDGLVASKILEHL